eukprot:5517961-Prymnesium_polylepis.1
MARGGIRRPALCASLHLRLDRAPGALDRAERLGATRVVGLVRVQRLGELVVALAARLEAHAHQGHAEHGERVAAAQHVRADGVEALQRLARGGGTRGRLGRALLAHDAQHE